MLLAVAIAWILAGSLGVGAALRHRKDVESLPPGAGRRRQRLVILVFGVVAIAMGLRRLYDYIALGGA